MGQGCGGGGAVLQASSSCTIKLDASYLFFSFCEDYMNENHLCEPRGVHSHGGEDQKEGDRKSKAEAKLVTQKLARGEKLFKSKVRKGQLGSLGLTCTH